MKMPKYVIAVLLLAIFVLKGFGQDVLIMFPSDMSNQSMVMSIDGSYNDMNVNEVRVEISYFDGTGTYNYWNGFSWGLTQASVIATLDSPATGDWLYNAGSISWADGQTYYIAVEGYYATSPVGGAVDSVEFTFTTGGPVFNYASYDASTNVLNIGLTEEISSVDPSVNLWMSVDGGGTSTAQINGPWSYSNYGWDIDIFIDSAQASVIEGWSSVETNLKVQVDSGAFQSTSAKTNNYLPWYGVSYIVPATTDSYEPDDVPGNATVLAFDAPQAHSIYPIGDEDWYVFTVPESACTDIVLETSGSTGYDTRMWLLSDSLDTLNFDDDGGTDTYSRIELNLCSGTYYVKVDEFSGNAEIPSYNMSLTVPPFGPTNAWYWADSNHLVVEFNQEVHTGTVVTSGLISLSTDDGGTNTLTLNTPLNVSPASGGNKIIFVVEETQAVTIESWPSDTFAALTMEMAKNLVTNCDESAFSPAIYWQDYFHVDRKAPPPPDPYITWADYDSSYGSFHIDWSEEITSTDNAQTIRVTPDGGTTFVDITGWIPSLNGGGCTNVEIDETSRQSINNWLGDSNAHLGIRINANAFQSLSGWNVQHSWGPVNVGGGYDSGSSGSGPDLISAHYDAGLNKLRLGFTENVADSAIDVYGYIRLQIPSTSNSLQLTTPLSVMAGGANDELVELQLTSTEATEIESWSGAPSSLHISMNGGIFPSPYSSASNGAVSDSIPHPVTYGSGPFIMKAAYDYDMDLLYLVFSDSVNSIDNTADVFLSVDNGAAYTVQIPEPWVYQVVEGDVVEIDASSVSSTVENWPDLNWALAVEVGSGIAMNSSGRSNVFMPYRPAFYYGSSGSGGVTGDSPALSSAWYDDYDGKLYLNFSSGIDKWDSTVRIALMVDSTRYLELYGWTPSFEGDIVIPLSAGDADIVRNWVDVELSLHVEIDAGAFSSYGYPNNYLPPYPVSYGGPAFTGKEWYVWNGAATQGDGKSPSNPFTSIQVALDAAADGDRIMVAEGVYNESKGLTVSARGIDFIGGFSTDFMGHNVLDYATIIDGGNASMPVMLQPKSGWRIEGFHFKNVAGTVIDVRYTEHTEVEFCYFFNCETPIALDQANYVDVRNSVMAHCQAGVVTIGGNGIFLMNNTFAYCSNAAISDNGTSITAVNNIFAFSRYGYYEADTVADSLWYNSFFGNQDMYQALGTVVNDIEQLNTLGGNIGNAVLDPAFMDTTLAKPDFRLSVTSECIDAGVLGPNEPLEEPWPDGGAPNLGAFGNTHYATPTLAPPVASFYADTVWGVDSLTVFFTDTVQLGGMADVEYLVYGDGVIDTFYYGGDYYDSSSTTDTVVMNDSTHNDSIKEAEGVYHHYSSPGVYTVTLIRVNQLGADTMTISDYITVYGSVVADFSADKTTGDGPLTIQFTNSSIGSYTTALWTFGDGNSSNEQSPTHTYQETGTYSVALSVNGPGGAHMVTRDAYITVVNSAPVLAVEPVFTLNEDVAWAYQVPVSDVNGDAVTITASGTPDGMTYDPATGSLAWTPTNDHIGTHTLTIVAVDEEGLSDTAAMTLTVVNVNDAPVVSAISLPDTGYEDSPVSGYVVVSDVDPGDSVTITLSSTLHWMSVTGVTVQSAGVWRFDLAGVPLDADTNLLAFTVTATDQNKGIGTAQGSIFIVNTNDAPETSIRSRRDAFGAVSYTVDGSDDFDKTLTYTGSLLALSGNTLSETVSNTTGAFEFYPLADGTYEFNVFTTDSEGLKDSTPAADTFVVQGATSHVLRAGAWGMISVPGINNQVDTIKAVGKLSHWDESGTKRDIYNYYVPSSEIHALEGGQGYWAKLDKDYAITLDQSALLDSAVSVSVAVTEYGWNQIANPYPYPVQWPGSGTLWRWDDNQRDFVEQTDGILYPWEGYWLQASAAATVTLSPVPVYPTAGTAKRTRDFFLTESEWRLQLVLNSEISRDADNVIGFSRHARDGIDDMDKLEPPRMGDEPYLYIAHDDWRGGTAAYASDIRRNIGDEPTVFQIAIAPGTGEAGDLTLSILGVGKLSNIHVFITDGNGLTEVKEGDVYEIPRSRQTLYRSLFVTTNRRFQEQYPASFGIADPYPNPFRPNAHIEYSLPYQWAENGSMEQAAYNVKMDIFDSQGRLVRQLVNRKQGPGHYHVVWNSSSNTGRPVSAGTYYCRLQTGTLRAITRMVLTK